MISQHTIVLGMSHHQAVALNSRPQMCARCKAIIKADQQWAAIAHPVLKSREWEVRVLCETCGPRLAAMFVEFFNEDTAEDSPGKHGDAKP